MIVTGGNAEQVRELARGDGSVEVVVVPARAGAGVCELRAEGVRRARGRRVAVLGERYGVTGEWLRAAAGSEWDAASGAVGPGALSYWGWVVYLSEYARLAPPVQDGAVEDFRLLAGGNAVYRAEAIDAEGLGACLTELEFHAGLKARGATAGRLAGLEVLYAVPPSVMEYVRERFRFSEAIARERGERWRALVAPALPWVVLARTGQEALRRPGLRGRWLACAPLILALGCVQAAGEIWGCGRGVRYPE